MVNPIQFAVNYSREAARLYRAGQIPLDRFKCPAWPDLISSAQEDGAVYVHFPLLVGTGQGHPINTETQGPPDWGIIEALMAETATPWVNVHLGPRPEDHPELAGYDRHTQVARITDALIRDLEPLVARFGEHRVVGENIFEYFGGHLRPAVFPEVLGRVLEETGCGLLLDLSHARLAAHDLGLDPYAYVSSLPTDRIREIHVTGIQRFGPQWVARLQDAQVSVASVTRVAGQWIDHLPMTPQDWRFFAWAMERIRRGQWRLPEIVAFEYGGVGKIFGALTIPEVLAYQVPRLYTMVHQGGF